MGVRPFALPVRRGSPTQRRTSPRHGPSCRHTSHEMNDLPLLLILLSRLSSSLRNRCHWRDPARSLRRVNSLLSDACWHSCGPHAAAGVSAAQLAAQQESARHEGGCAHSSSCLCAPGADRRRYYRRRYRWPVCCSPVAGGAQCCRCFATGYAPHSRPHLQAKVGFVLVESASEVGGRVRTDSVEVRIAFTRYCMALERRHFRGEQVFQFKATIIPKLRAFPRA